ncbi:TPA: hypothetical protein ACGO78_001680, partial [Streptococcus suis]
ENLLKDIDIVKVRIIAIIEDLEKLKQSLISEVVTGQIDVRDVVIPEYEKFTLEIDEELEKEVEENE